MRPLLRLSHLILSACAALSLTVALRAGAETPEPNVYGGASDFAAHALKLRDNALLKVEPQVAVPSTTGWGLRFGSKYPWKQNIVTTVFWVGERPTANNPTPNNKSSWDGSWAYNYGGFDNPESRKGYIPAAFVPRLNPFYFALPYNDVSLGKHKPEAPMVIPWFRQALTEPGKTVLRGRWIAIKKGTRTAYAQWEDCGPFRTDHYQYVFGNDRPRANLNHGAGLDVSPAVRDYLGLAPTDVTNWRFVDENEVPNGPWRQYGENNPFVQRQSGTRMVKIATNEGALKAIVNSGARAR
jgi:hypothetical protein